MTKAGIARRIAGTLFALASAGALAQSDVQFNFAEYQKYWAKFGDDANLPACTKGARQSPIALPASAQWAPVEPITRNYAPYPASNDKLLLINNGHTLELVLDPEEYRPAKPGKESLFEKLGEKRMKELRANPPPVRGYRRGYGSFKVLQLHFHAPSEHQLDRTRYPMEMHIVHEGPEGLSVMAVFLTGGPEEADHPLEPILGFKTNLQPLDTKDQPVLAIDRQKVNLDRLVPPWMYRQYLGSLTTPKCTENVTWIVFNRPTVVPQRLIDRFRAHYANNARALQPLNNRPVVAPQ